MTDTNNVKTRAEVVADARAKAAALTPKARLAAIKAMFDMRAAALTNLTGNQQRTQQLFSLLLARCSRQPELLLCEPTSLYLAAQKIAALGLSPLPERKHFYLIPYKNREMGGVREATLQVSYHGMVYLARSHPEVADVWADVVYRGEHFEQDRFAGTITHKVGLRDGLTEADMVAAYAVVRMRSGQTIFEVLSRDDVNRRRAKARSQDFWGGWPHEMWCKTAVRKLLNSERVPKKDALSEALGGGDEDLAVPADFTVVGDVTSDDVLISDEAAADAGDEGGSAADAKPPTEREKLLAEVEDLGRELLVNWDDMASQCVKLCGGKPPASLDSLTTIQAQRLKGWLESLPSMEAKQ